MGRDFTVLTRFARHQFQNAKVAPHPSVNIWQIANHSIWHKEHLFCFFGGLVHTLDSLKLSSSPILYHNISSCSQKYCLYIFCFKRVDGGCEDTYNDNLWGTNCNNFVDSLAQTSTARKADGQKLLLSLDYSVTRVHKFTIAPEMETVSHILNSQVVCFFFKNISSGLK